MWRFFFFSFFLCGRPDADLLLNKISSSKSDQSTVGQKQSSRKDLKASKWFLPRATVRLDPDFL